MRRRNPMPTTGALLVNPRRKRRAAAKKRTTKRKRNTAASRSTAAKKAAATRKRNARKRSMIAKKAAATRKRNTRKRNGTRKGMVRKTARRAYSRKRNTARRRRNTAPKTVFSGILGPVQKMLKKIPVLGGPLSEMAGFAGPAALAAVSVEPSLMLMKYVGSYLPASLQALNFTILGSAMAVVVAPRVPGVKPATKKQLAVAMASAGGAIDYYRWRTGQSTVEEMSTAGIEMGDGMAYTVQPYGALEVMAGAGKHGALEVMAGAHSMAGMHDQAMAGDYMTAGLGDAYYSGADFSGEEAAAILAGPRAFRRRFGRPAQRMRRSSGRLRPVSQMANKHGHRWGWLIKLIGFSKMQQIAALPPQQRQQVIAQLRQQAVASLPALLAQQASGAQDLTASEAEAMGAIVTMA